MIPIICFGRWLIKSLSPEDASTYHLLQATHHKDPFDRMLIWQAIRNDYIFVSADKQIKKYAKEGLKLFPPTSS